MIIKVRRVSVARLNHAAPRMIDAPLRMFPIHISAYFHWSHGTCSLNATSAFVPAQLLLRGGNSNRGLDIARCEIRAATGASRAAICSSHYFVYLPVALSARLIPYRRFDNHVHSCRLCHFCKSNGYVTKFSIIR